LPGSLGRVAQKDAPGNPARCRITCTCANRARHISPKQSRSSVSLARSCSASLLGEFASCSASLLGICSGELAACRYVWSFTPDVWFRSVRTLTGRWLVPSPFSSLPPPLFSVGHFAPSMPRERSFRCACVVRPRARTRPRSWSACFTVDQPRCAQCRAGRPPGEGSRIRGPKEWLGCTPWRYGCCLAGCPGRDGRNRAPSLKRAARLTAVALHDRRPLVSAFASSHHVDDAECEVRDRRRRRRGQDLPAHLVHHQRLP